MQVFYVHLSSES